MFNLESIQSAIRDQQLDGWLLYDFRGSNLLAQRVLGLTEKKLSRRWYYFIPASGEPRKLVHAIEPAALDSLPGSKTTYRRWQELEEGVCQLVIGSQQVAMEYSPKNGNPYVSKVDAGTIELVRSFGANVVSSGDLIQMFEATWDLEQEQSHFEAAKYTSAAYGMVYQFIAEEIRARGKTSECAVQQKIMNYFADNGMTTYSPPIVGVGPHSGDPHFEPKQEIDTPIVPGSFVLIDLWAKMDRPRAVYSDLTRVAYVGETVPEKYTKIFQIVANARDAAIKRVKDAFAAGEVLLGNQVDHAAREVIDRAGYSNQYTHRTGHNIGQEVHGNGAHMDGLETRENRRVLARTCFSIEPGIYLEDFGVRSEVDVYIDANNHVHVTGGELQTSIDRILV